MIPTQDGILLLYDIHSTWAKYKISINFNLGKSNRNKQESVKNFVETKLCMEGINTQARNNNIGGHSTQSQAPIPTGQMQ